jgi:hypothetical protein
MKMEIDNLQQKLTSLENIIHNLEIENICSISIEEYYNLKIKYDLLEKENNNLKKELDTYKLKNI